MIAASVDQDATAGKGLIACIVCPLILLFIYVVLGWFERFTTLTPSDDRVLHYCLVVACVAGLVNGSISIRESRGLSSWRRAVTVPLIALLAALVVFMVCVRSANIIYGFVDFPPRNTKTFSGLLIIARAYRTHGKGASWDIQTTPIWSDLNVTEADFDFMLAHRAPGDHGHNADEISSHGYFCAQVTMQMSGTALRVMHAGSQKLPIGTVIICPTVTR